MTYSLSLFLVCLGEQHALLRKPLTCITRNFRSFSGGLFHALLGISSLQASLSLGCIFLPSAYATYLGPVSAEAAHELRSWGMHVEFMEMEQEMGESLSLVLYPLTLMSLLWLWEFAAQLLLT